MHLLSIDLQKIKIFLIDYDMLTIFSSSTDQGIYISTTLPCLPDNIF